jgi:hypothetical protein
VTQSDVSVGADAFRALTVAFAGLLRRAFRDRGPDDSGVPWPDHPREFEDVLFAGAEVAARESLKVARALGEYALDRRFLIDPRSNFVLAHAMGSAQALGDAYRDTGGYSLSAVRDRVCPLWPFC